MQTIHRRRFVLTAAAVVICLAVQVAWAAGSQSTARPSVRTPIEHVIVVIGENHTFDSLLATYVPKHGATVRNLLSQGIINADGSPGPKFSLAEQRSAELAHRYMLDPPRAPAYAHLPRPRLTGVQDMEFNGVGRGVDERFPAGLPNGPFQITRYVPYPRAHAAPTLASATVGLAAATGDPVHRFFQMWQQTGGDNAKLDLYVWVGISAGAGGDTDGVTQQDPGQGGEAMGFVNMSAGDAAYLREMADAYAISDNYHQAVMGGTGMNFFALSTADSPVFNLGGKLDTPPANQIEDPDPVPGSENFYRRDGYQGGSYVNCADPTQPGVDAILSVLARKGVKSRCEPGAYYLVNNYGAGFDLDGRRRPLGAGHYTYPPQNVPTIAEALSARGISWKWYTGGREAADLRAEVAKLHLSLDAARSMQYNDIGDPLVASIAVMSRRELRSRLQGSTAFFQDVAMNRLPAVSFVVPKNIDSGHPGYSVIANYEDALRSIVRGVQANKHLWAHTAIIATTDEGGGYFDSGYIQVLDFFGDGPRIPLLVISPHAKRGHVDHVYNDHASILKFIERNWGLQPLSARSRDNFSNPVADAADPYRPVNGPAIGDLMSMFEF
jgi:phospholipase C